MPKPTRRISIGQFLALLAFCVPLALATSSPALGITYNLHVRAYCPPGDEFCGFIDRPTYEQRVLEAVQEMNLQWEPTGISFRPVIATIQVETYWSEIPACDNVALDNGQQAKDRRAEWKEMVALLDSPDGFSLMITAGGGKCCSHIPKDPYIPGHPETLVDRLGIFCRANTQTSFTAGSVWAHEMGHQFCLRHPFTGEDLEQTLPGAPNHDNDAAWDVFDTPDDPGAFEGYPNGGSGSKPEKDENQNGSLRSGHQWCDAFADGPTPDDGSPHTADVCVSECYLTPLGGGAPDFDPGFEPMTIAMSYYSNNCLGPYVVDGQRTEAFTEDQLGQIEFCRTALPERASLDDACEGLGGDFDHDGICDDPDNCSTVRNTPQSDLDMDGLGDPCDPCPENPGGFEDLDNDGVGDACDDDDDDDGCDDDVDQHPRVKNVVIGYAFDGDCGFGLEPLTHFEGEDSDGDGFKDCEDWDDDNDGICDEGGPLPPGTPGTLGGCADGGEGLDACHTNPNPLCFPVGSPAECQPDWLVCVGGNCVANYFLKWVSLINPALEIVVDTFEIHDRTAYFGAVNGRTLSETALAMRGDFAAVEVPVAGEVATGSQSQQLGDPVRLEIWSRSLNQRVAIVGEYTDSDVFTTSAATGRFLAITMGTNSSGGLRIDLGATDDRGVLPTILFADADGDGRSDTADNCRDTENFAQVDADGDGCGNACDADFDNDGMTTSLDTLFMGFCQGADLTIHEVVGEPDDEGEGGYTPTLPDPGALTLAVACRAADLNNDLLVDVQDTILAKSLEGFPPGPCLDSFPTSSCSPANCEDGSDCTVDICDASFVCRHLPSGCDDGNACTADACGLTSNQCEHTPIACNDNSGCTADSCDPDVGCLFEPILEGFPCNDGQACTTGDQCLDGACTGAPVVCDDGDACTVDECFPVGGGSTCLFDPVVCDDGNPCTTAACDSGTGCESISLEDGTACSDGSSCTLSDQCQGGLCEGAPMVCNDNNSCTTDSCNGSGPTGTCEFVSLACDDGDACTVDSCLGATGICIHQPVVLAEPRIGFGSETLLTWTASPQASHSNTYRGTIPVSGFFGGGPGSGYDHVCLENADFALDGPSSTRDWQNPPSQTAYYYLVTEENECGEGSVGENRTTDQFCPTPSGQ